MAYERFFQMEGKKILRPKHQIVWKCPIEDHSNEKLESKLLKTEVPSTHAPNNATINKSIPSVEEVWISDSFVVLCYQRNVLLKNPRFRLVWTCQTTKGFINNCWRQNQFRIHCTFYINLIRNRRKWHVIVTYQNFNYLLLLRRKVKITNKSPSCSPSHLKRNCLINLPSNSIMVYLGQSKKISFISKWSPV